MTKAKWKDLVKEWNENKVETQCDSEFCESNETKYAISLGHVSEGERYPDHYCWKCWVQHVKDIEEHDKFMEKELKGDE